jgi:uncharacterized protein (DUF488 family)
MIGDRGERSDMTRAGTKILKQAEPVTGILECLTAEAVNSQKNNLGLCWKWFCEDTIRSKGKEQQRKNIS